MLKADRRIKKTREAINQALIALMSEKNFENITINDISEKADLNRGTLYLHYADKYDLLDQCIQDHLNAMLTYCTIPKPNEEKVDVTQSLLPMFRYFEEHYLFFSSMLKNKGISCFGDRLNQMINNGLRERLTNSETNQEDNNEVIIQFMTSAFVGVVEWWIRNEMPYSPLFMAQKLWDILEANYHANRSQLQNGI